MQEFGGTPRTSLQLSSLFRSISHLITLRTLRDHRMLISNGGAELLMDSSAKFPPGRGEADTKATSPLIQASVSADSPNGRYRLHRRPVTQGAQPRGTRVRCMARHPEHLQTPHSKAEIVRADCLDPAFSSPSNDRSSRGLLPGCHHLRSQRSTASVLFLATGQVVPEERTTCLGVAVELRLILLSALTFQTLRLTRPR